MPVCLQKTRRETGSVKSGMCQFRYTIERLILIKDISQWREGFTPGSHPAPSPAWHIPSYRKQGRKSSQGGSEQRDLFSAVLNFVMLKHPAI